MDLLENWYITSVYGWMPYLHGNIYGKSELKNKEKIITDSIIEINLEQNYAKTRNANYLLGEPNVLWIDLLGENGLSIKEYIRGIKTINS